MNMAINSLLKFIQSSTFLPVSNLITIILLALTTLAGFLASRAASIANKLKLLPFFIISFTNDTKDINIKIKNLGEGVAFDLKIEPFILILTDHQDIFRLYLKIKDVNVLAKDEEKVLKSEVFENDKKMIHSDFLTIYLKPNFNDHLKKVGLVVIFKNALGDKYFSVVETSSEGINVQVPPKRLDIFGYLWLYYRRLREFVWIKVWQLIWHFRKPYIKVS